MKEINRRQFLKYGLGGLAALVVGSEMPWIFDSKVYAAVRVKTLNFHITDAMKEMVTHNAINDARCYFWVYKEDRFPADCPGPIIFATRGDRIEVTITNDLDEDHAFAIPDLGFTTGPIAPGQTVTKSFVVRKSGTYLYYDNLNWPVNRVMGLHGALVVMPKVPARVNARRRITPYDRPSSVIRRLFNDLGSEHYPGLAWEEGDPGTDTPAFRQYVWLIHEASSVLFAEVGDYTPGQDYTAREFVNAFLNDPYADTFHTGIFNRKAQYFTINGQSGYFSHHNPYITPHHRVGEPCMIRCLNAGLHIHSLHIHANHVYVLAENHKFEAVPGQPNNLIWVDTFTLHPLDTYDWLVPYQRPPDVPNERGIGMADAPLAVDPTPVPAPWGPGAGPTTPGETTWPPIQELDMFIPNVGEVMASDPNGNPIDMARRLAPLCYPMHDHSENSQTAQGGNYNLGLMGGIYFTGDRNAPGGVVTFPHSPALHNPGPDGVFPPTVEFNP